MTPGPRSEKLRSRSQGHLIYSGDIMSIPGVTQYNVVVLVQIVGYSGG